MRSRPASRGPALGPSPFLSPSFFPVSLSPALGAGGGGPRSPGRPGARAAAGPPAGLPVPPAASARPGLSPAARGRPGAPRLPRDFPRRGPGQLPSALLPPRVLLSALGCVCLFSPPGSASVPQDFPPGPGGRFPAPFPRPRGRFSLPETGKDGQAESSA